MAMTYQQEFVLAGVAGRAAILNLNARQNGLFSTGDFGGWVATFRHAGATVTRDGQMFTNLRDAFDGGNGQRLVTVDHEITVDGVDATQNCVALLFVGAELRATGVYRDKLIYERGGWYFTSRELEWDVVPSKDALPL
ncbi:nuclear transport factor 2 family protein [Mycobacterium sp. ITM-2016-00318]|uniref:nuclear transport factor 2 family protein n=1 Tax=Mycobacterium sp. ITM-2016-00318 TaxID=2099693 RepID=UPI000CF86E9C|nr:nuclear transport factor 2 family protein [Mycobacterium sp. ITM-2016-00318]WNG91542.1 nuclear transport factor 2 family protein [Mycobacterium sp. ITM-2016-00318]